MTIIGVEINGGSGNSVDTVSLQTNRDNTKAVVLNNSSDNNIRNIQIISHEDVKRLKEIKSNVEGINDFAINSVTNNPFKEDIANCISTLIDTNNLNQNNLSSLRNIISLLSDWISIKNELKPVLIPYIVSLQSILGA